MFAQYLELYIIVLVRQEPSINTHKLINPTLPVVLSLNVVDGIFIVSYKFSKDIKTMLICSSKPYFCYIICNFYTSEIHTGYLIYPFLSLPF